MSDNKKPSSSGKLIRINGGIEWRTDELLGWAFEQLESIAQEENLESIAIVVRYSDKDNSSYSDFVGSDLVGLAGAVSILHKNIIDYTQENGD